MEIKLKSVFRSPKLRLAVKAVVFALFLLLAQAGQLGFWSVLFFLIATLFLYSAPLFRTVALAPFLLVLIVTCLLFTGSFGDSRLFGAVVVYFAVLFYLILGIKDLAFVSRENWERLLGLGLAYPVFFMFFYHAEISFSLRLIGLFLAVVCLARGIIGKRLAGWLATLAVLEAAWAISLLPVGFVNAASLLAIFYFFLADICALNYRDKALTKRRMLLDVTVFVVLAVLILAFSRWSL